MHPATRHCKCCPDGPPCSCGCPCGTSGGMVSCNGLVNHPLDVTITMSVNPMLTEFHFAEGTRLYDNETDIAASIAETDPNPDQNIPGIGDLYKGRICKARVEWTVDPTTYTLTDNTSMMDANCTIAHQGYLYRRFALNGDTYEFDAMGGLPRLKNTFSLLSSARRSGNDYTYEDDEVHEHQDYEFFTGDSDSNAIWNTTASAYYDGSTALETSWTPFSKLLPSGPTGTNSITTYGIRRRWKNTNTIVSTGFIRTSYGIGTVGNWGHPWASMPGIQVVPGTTPIPPILPFELAPESQTVGTINEPSTPVCKGDVSITNGDYPDEVYTFDPSEYQGTAGSFVQSSYPSVFTESTRSGGPQVNPDPWIISEISSEASVATRSNPGAINCPRCYDVLLTETDGDTLAVTTIFEGMLYQSTGGRVPPGIDPATWVGWTHYPVWLSWNLWSGGTFPQLKVGRVGKTLWIGQFQESAGSPLQIYYMKATGDCLDTITDVCADVEELSSSEIVSVPGVSVTTTRTSRLKINTRSFTASEAECVECIEDPCEEPCDPATITAYNTAEVSGSGLDFEWQMETSNGSGVFTNAVVLTSYPGTYSAPPDTDVGWIGIDETAAPPGGTRVFRTYVECTGTQEQLDSMSLDGLLGVDDEIGTISVDGVVVLSSVGGTFTSFSTFSIPGTALHPGTNIIDFELINPGTVDAAGLLVRWTNDYEP